LSEVENNNPTYNFTDEDVSLKELLRPLWTRRWKIIFCTLLVTLMVAFYVSLLKPSYKATATLHIGSNIPSKALSINEAFSDASATKEQVQTQYELLRSRQFAERIVKELNLTQHPEFTATKYNQRLSFLADKPNQKPPSLSNVIQAVQDRLTISPVSGTELVTVTFTSYFAKLSKDVANQVGATFIEYQDEIHNNSKESTSQWLVGQLQELGKKLDASESKLQVFKEEEGLVDIQGVRGLIGSEVTSLTAALLKDEKELDDLTITYQYLQANKSNIEKLTDLHEVNTHRSYYELMNTEERIKRKISEISKRYGPKHPKLISAYAELEAININVAKQVNNQVLSIEKDYFTAVSKLNVSKSRLSKAKSDYMRLSKLENKFSQLQREVETNKELYNNYLIRLKEADAMGDYNANFYVRLIDRATEPGSPFAPRKSLLVVVSFILSLIMVCIYVIMRELLMDTLNSRRKLDNFQEAQVLAVLPKFKYKPSADGDKYSVDNRFTEAVRTLRTSLLFNNEKQPPKVIAITSSVPNEGKSTVALHLARSFSEMEKVLLIEADMRHPTLAKNLGLELHRPGLSNLLAKTHQINECIVRDKNVKLDILTSGISPANPLAFLSMKRLDMLIKVFGNFYDRIVIETPPVNAVSDAVIISRLVESVLYVVHGSKTRKDQITSGLRMLKQVRAPIEGIVINHSQNIDTNKYQNKYYNDMGNIIKLPVRKQG